jgi:hypothetical protein
MKKPKSDLHRAVMTYARRAAKENRLSETTVAVPAPPTPPRFEAAPLSDARRARIVASLKRLHPMA